MTEKQARKNLTLEVLIATCGPEGGKRVAAMALPVIERVKYLVSWQDPQDAPVPEALSSRKDVRVLPLPGRGLSHNRNHCLDNATGDLLMIADDDLRLYPEGLKAVIRTFEDNPTLEYGSFRYDSDYPKEYPAQECSLAVLPKNFFQASVEIVIRRESETGTFRFHESFGLGTCEYTAGEEDLFLKKVRNSNLDCRFFPITTCFHPGQTTGIRSRLAPGAIKAKGVCTAVEYPLTALPRILINTIRITRTGQASFLRAFSLMTYGAWKATFTPLVKSYLDNK